MRQKDEGAVTTAYQAAWVAHKAAVDARAKALSAGVRDDIADLGSVLSQAEEVMARVKRDLTEDVLVTLLLETPLPVAEIRSQVAGLLRRGVQPASLLPAIWAWASEVASRWWGGAGSLRCRGNPRLVMDCLSFQAEVTGRSQVSGAGACA